MHSRPEKVDQTKSICLLAAKTAYTKVNAAASNQINENDDTKLGDFVPSTSTHQKKFRTQGAFSKEHPQGGLRAGRPRGETGLPTFHAPTAHFAREKQDHPRHAGGVGDVLEAHLLASAVIFWVGWGGVGWGGVGWGGVGWGGVGWGGVGWGGVGWGGVGWGGVGWGGVGWGGVGWGGVGWGGVGWVGGGGVGGVGR